MTEVPLWMAQLNKICAGVTLSPLGSWPRFKLAFTLSTTLLTLSSPAERFFPKGEYAVTCIPCVLQNSKRATWGRQGWDSIWFTAGMIRIFFSDSRRTWRVLMEKFDTPMDLALPGMYYPWIRLYGQMSEMWKYVPANTISSICFQVSRTVGLWSGWRVLPGRKCIRFKFNSV